MFNDQELHFSSVIWILVSVFLVLSSDQSLYGYCDGYFYNMSNGHSVLNILSRLIWATQASNLTTTSWKACQLWYVLYLQIRVVLLLTCTYMAYILPLPRYTYPE